MVDYIEWNIELVEIFLEYVEVPQNKVDPTGSAIMSHIVLRAEDEKGHKWDIVLLS
jgi:hypothetical protein